MTTQKEEMNKRFDDNFVHAHIWNDMHNQPILYNTDFDDIKKIKSFLQSEIDLAVAEERKRIVEMIEKMEFLDKTNIHHYSVVQEMILSLITKEK